MPLRSNSKLRGNRGKTRLDQDWRGDCFSSVTPTVVPLFIWKVRTLKSVTLVLMLLVAAFYIACQIEVPPSDASISSPTMSREQESAGNVAWRRTLDGWERMSDWTPRRVTPSAIPAVDFGIVHPSLVAILQLLLSVGALILFPLRRPTHRRNAGKSVKSSRNLPRSSR